MKSPRQIANAISELNLDRIYKKLLVEGLSKKQALQGINLYRKFLIKVARDKNTSPTTEVDKVWHTHILDTLKYTEDCQRTFGYYLHHEPQLASTHCNISCKPKPKPECEPKCRPDDDCRPIWY